MSRLDTALLAVVAEQDTGPTGGWVARTAGRPAEAGRGCRGGGMDTAGEETTGQLV